MVLRVKWTSLSSSCTAGEAGHSLKFSFLWGRNHGLRRSFLSLNCATWGSSDAGKVICLASFTFSRAYKLVFFALEECSNFNSGNLDIHKVSHTHKWLSKCFPGAPRPQSRGTGVCSWDTAGSGSSWGSTLGPNTPITQSIGWQDSPWVPLHMMWDPTAQTKAVFFHGWIPDCCYWRGKMNRGHIFQPCCSCHSKVKILIETKIKVYLSIR